MMTRGPLVRIPIRARTHKRAMSRFQGQSGLEILTASHSAFDPLQKSGHQTVVTHNVASAV